MLLELGNTVPHITVMLLALWLKFCSHQSRVANIP